MNEYDVKRLGLILAVQAEVEGMKAENTIRVICGFHPAYGDDVFQCKAEEIRNIVNCPNEKL